MKKKGGDKMKSHLALLKSFAVDMCLYLAHCTDDTFYQAFNSAFLACAPKYAPVSIDELFMFCCKNIMPLEIAFDTLPLDSVFTPN